jgi:hypothetical protein
MESALSATFEILSFGAVIVLVVLGLGIIAGMMGMASLSSSAPTPPISFTASGCRFGSACSEHHSL